MYSAFVLIESCRRYPFIKLVCIADSIVKCSIKIAEGLPSVVGGQAQANHAGSSGGHFERVVRRSLGSLLGRVDRSTIATDEERVKRVFDVNGCVWHSP